LEIRLKIINKHFQNFQKVPEICVPEKTDYHRDLTDSDEIQNPSRSKAGKNFDTQTFSNSMYSGVSEQRIRKRFRDDNADR